MTELSHEDIRSLVTSKIRSEILRIITELIRDPQIETKLREELGIYEKLVREEKDVPLIIKNEKREEVGRPDIELFGGRIIIEVKVKVSEFEKGKDQLQSYVEVCPFTNYAILTNNEDWQFYEVKDGKLSFITGNPEYLINILKNTLTKKVKLELSTENVKNMFSPIASIEDEFYKFFLEFNVKETPLFKAYKNIINRLYEETLEEEVERLFIKHTLMQMIVASCLTIALGKETTPVRACSGEEIESEVVLPYLRWWTEHNEKGFIRSLTESIYSRSLLFDWESGNKEDIFRELYEILIDAETRRRLGEYYTPLWLVEYMVKEVSKELKNKIVLDPFCGTGTFLVMSFHRKVSEEGEDPDEAIREVIGFDINPLSVSIARAELMVAYNNYRKGVVTPLIFNTDSATLLLREEGEAWQPLSLVEELKELEKRIEYIDSPLFEISKIDFSEILRIERILRNILEKSPDKIAEELKKLGSEKWEGFLTKSIVNVITSEENIKMLSDLVRKYGNGVWALSITSLFAPHLIRKIKADVIVTNPPWRLLTEIKGSYGEFLREKAGKLLKHYENRGQIIGGVDLASILLHGCKSIVKTKGEVAFLMPKEVVYTFGSYHGLGKILTYEIIRGFKGKIVELNIDAFQHGRYACIVFLKEEEGIKTYQLDIKLSSEEKYSKNLHLKDINYVERAGESYHQHMEKVKSYLEYPSEVIKEKLCVQDVVAKGDHIMGLFGGVKKRGAKSYAGLVFEVSSFDTISGEYFIRLSQTTKPIKIPEYFLKNYWKSLIYTDNIFPFYFGGFYNVILSSDSEEDLKNFLKEELEKFSDEDKRRVKSLIKELKQPKRPNFLDKGRYYVVYRRMRSPASFVLAPTKLQEIPHEVIICDECSYMALNDENKAYYYSTIINFMTYEVIMKKGAFERSQFLRPLIAIVEAGLEWKGESWQEKVAKLGKELQDKITTHPQVQIKKGLQVKNFFKKLNTKEEYKNIFNEIQKLVNENVNKEKLNNALKRIAKLK